MTLFLVELIPNFVRFIGILLIEPAKFELGSRRKFVVSNNEKNSRPVVVMKSTLCCHKININQFANQSLAQN